ncbi:hypothetical protein PZA11_002886 [Diplocarpon coronariae]
MGIMLKSMCAMADLFYVALVLLGFAAVVLGAGNQSVEFSYPPAGLTLNYMDTINVSYTSNSSKPLTLYTFCTKVNSAGPLKKQKQFVPANNGSGLVLLSWPDVDSCYFDIRRNKTAKSGVRSHFVQVLSIARPTPIIVGLDQNSTTIPVKPTDIATATGHSNGVKIGIGVGVTLGVVIITAAGFVLFFMKRRRKTKKQAQWPPWKVVNDNPNPYSGDRGAYVPMESIPSEIAVKNNGEASHELTSERTFEIDNGRIVGELSAESEIQTPGLRRFSWERTPVG